MREYSVVKGAKEPGEATRRSSFSAWSSMEDFLEEVTPELKLEFGIKIR